MIVFNCYQALLWSGPISFLMKYRLICLFSVLSDAIFTLLNFFFIKADINFGCNQCLLFLLFVLTCLPNNGWSHQSSATFFTPLSHLLCRWSFCSYIVLKNYLKKTEIQSVVHLADFSPKVGWAGSELYVRTHMTEPPC